MTSFTHSITLLYIFNKLFSFNVKFFNITGTWIEGERLDWLSYPISLEQTKAFVDAFHTPKTFIGLHAEMIADGFPHLPDGVDNTDPAVKMIVGGILRANSKTAGMFQKLKK